MRKALPWRLTARRLPIPFGRHRLDQLLARHRFAGLAQHLGGSVDGAQLAAQALCALGLAGPLDVGRFLLLLACGSLPDAAGSTSSSWARA